LTLLLLLMPRFWQRGVAVTYCQRNMAATIALQAFAPVAPVTNEPAAPPEAPRLPPETQVP
jgi:hypothetical protein